MKKQNQDSDIIKEWLAAGNKITICPAGERTEDLVVSPWKKSGRKPAKKKATASK